MELMESLKVGKLKMIHARISLAHPTKSNKTLCGRLVDVASWSRYRNRVTCKTCRRSKWFTSVTVDRDFRAEGPAGDGYGSEGRLYGSQT